MYSAHRKPVRVVAATLALIGAVASLNCSSTTESAGCKQLSEIIKPGQRVPCLCADGKLKKKLCQDDGKFAECGPCTAKVACPSGIEPGQSIACKCSDGTKASQSCMKDGNLSECGDCDSTTFVDGGQGGGTCNHDGKVDPGEACDDGNDVETDNCTSDCVVYKDAKPNACPGQPVAVWPTSDPTKDLIVHGTTNGHTLKHKAKSACGPTGLSQAGNSPDRVYAVTVMEDAAWLDVAIIDATFEHSLWVNSTCADPATQIVCADKSPTEKEFVSVPNVKAGVTYYVWVDGEQNSAGEYTIRLRLR